VQLQLSFAQLRLVCCHTTCMPATRLVCLSHNFYACHMTCMHATRLARRARPDIHQTISWAKLCCNCTKKNLFSYNLIKYNPIVTNSLGCNRGPLKLGDVLIWFAINSNTCIVVFLKEYFYCKSKNSYSISIQYFQQLFLYNIIYNVNWYLRKTLDGIDL
jgi:hypothetical protein